MRVLVISDGLGENDAVATTELAAKGWREGAEDELDLVPVSAGGRGFLRVLDANIEGEFGIHTVRGPLGADVPTSIFYTGTGSTRTAYIEAAEVCGLHLVPAAQRDPRRTTTIGIADALIAARDSGATRIVVGIGDTATNDAGAGMLAALGAGSVEKLGAGPLSLPGLTSGDVDLGLARESLAGIDLIAACATHAPLAGFTGASGAYAQHKGADREMAQQLERALTGFASLCEEIEDADGKVLDPGVLLAPGEPAQGVDVKQLRTLAGAGSGGGLGFGLGLLGARLLPGSEVVSAALNIEKRAAAADLVFAVTDGMDATTLGDGPLEIAVAAGRANALATVALARRVDAGNRELATAGISAAYELFDTVTGVENAPESLVLQQRVSRIARSWSR